MMIPDGAPDHVVRTVTENCRTMRVTGGFEKAQILRRYTMVFFVPGCKDKQAEYAFHKASCEWFKRMGNPVDNRKVYSLRFRHDGNIYDAVVGRDLRGDLVMTIHHDPGDRLYYVCTVHRHPDNPVFVGSHDVESVVDFDS